MEILNASRSVFKNKNTGFVNSAQKSVFFPYQTLSVYETVEGLDERGDLGDFGDLGLRTGDASLRRTHSMAWVILLMWRTSAPVIRKMSVSFAVSRSSTVQHPLW